MGPRCWPGPRTRDTQRKGAAREAGLLVLQGQRAILGAGRGPWEALSLCSQHPGHGAAGTACGRAHFQGAKTIQGKLRTCPCQMQLPWHSGLADWPCWPTRLGARVPVPWGSPVLTI